MERLQLVHRGLLRGPTDHKAFSVARSGLGDDVEVDVIHFLVCDAAVILKT